MSLTSTAPDQGPGGRVLDRIERLGNRLPEPFTLFLWLLLIVGALSTVVSWFGVSAIVPGTDKTVEVKGLFSAEGVAWFMTTAVTNFIEFPPLGVVLTLLLAVGVAERTGLLLTLVRSTVGRAPRWALPYAVALTALVGHIMSDASFLVIPPIAAAVFRVAGRNPVAGLLGAYAVGVAGFSCTPFVTSTDALLAGLSNAAAKPVAGLVLTVTPVSNLYLNLVLSVLLVVAGGLIIDKILEPRLDRLGVGTGGSTAEDAGGEGDPAAADVAVTPVQKRALRWAGGTLLVVVAALLALVLPAGAPLRNPDGTLLPKSPLLSSVVFIVFLVLILPAIVYGFRAKTLTGMQSMAEMMTRSVKDIAPFLVVAFALAQFLALFSWSGLATWVAVNGAEALQNAEFTGFGAILAFLLAVSLLNLLITSGSSLWTLIAAVFVPMMALIGYEAGFTQAVFRLGDSATQVLTPLNPLLVVVLGWLRIYEPKAGIGSILGRMLPFAVVFWVLWLLVIAVFFFTGTGTGPGMDIYTGTR